MAWSKPEWNAPMGDQPTRSPISKKRNSRLVIMRAGLVFVLGALAAWLMITAPQEVESVPEPPKAVKTKSALKPAAKAKPVPTSAKVSSSLPRPKVSGDRIEGRENIPTPPPIEELNAALTNMVKKKVKVPFRNRSEQLIALALPSSPGAPVPPLPPVTEESLAGHLEKDLGHVIEAEEGDSEEILERKETVLAAKDEFRALREREGWSFTEYVQALRDQANEDSAFLASAHRLCDEVYHDKAVSDGEYIKFRDEVNGKLRERGLPEIGKEEESAEEVSTTKESDHE